MGPCSNAQIPNENNKKDISRIEGLGFLSPFTLTENVLQSQTGGFPENWKDKSEETGTGRSAMAR